MKRCPDCRRDYYDDSLLYCLDDGTALLDGPASGDARTEFLPLDSTEDHVPTRKQFLSRITADEDIVEGPSTPTGNRRVDDAGTTARSKTSSLKLAAAVILVVGLAGSGYLGYRLLNSETLSTQPFAKIKLSRVTNEGNVESVTISPDGKYIAYVTIDGEASTLWTKHLATGSRIQIAQQSNSLELYPSTFTLDGNYLIYSTRDRGASAYDVYQVPVLGGSGRKLLTGTTGIISISPSGREMSYARVNDKSLEASIIVGNIDGTGDRTLTTRGVSDWVGVFGTSWSPTGTDLVAGHYPSGLDNKTLVKINVKDGQVSPFTEKKFNFLGLAKWLSDGSGVVLIGKEKQTDTEQVWFISASNGHARKITSDLDTYRTASLAPTADAKTLVVLQHQMVPAAYLASINDLGSLRRISVQNDGAWSLNWDRSGRLFYVSGPGERTTWVFEPNAKVPKVFMQENGTGAMAVSPDGRYSVFKSDRSGYLEIWRADIDGSNAKQLTFGVKDLYDYAISPDGRSIVFSLLNNGLWKVPIDGGNSAKIAEGQLLLWPQFSPDGSQLASLAWDADGKKQIRLFKMEGEQAQLVRSIDLPSTAYTPLRWSNDGRSLIFTNTVGRVSNLWQQPLDGSQPKKLTNFDSERIVDFAVSPDGKQIAFARGPSTSDAVLITDER